MNQRVAAEQGCRVSLDRVCKSYGEIAALHELSLEIREGEFFTLLGPSGSGKTTLLMILAGFIAPSGGAVVLNGVDITRVEPQHRNIGMVFQSYALFPHMTVFDNVAFPLQARHLGKSEIRSRVGQALALVKLDQLAHRYPSELSGGQQQRVALARAIVFDAPLLLMDEPLGALDKNLREHMQIELLNIKTQLHRTVVYVTHDQEEALVMSDRILVMAEGRVQQIGTAEDLYERPANRFVAEFIGVANILQGCVRQKDSKHAWIETDAGRRIQVLPRRGGWAENERVSVVIRPERITVGADARGLDNCYNGQVVQVIYLGETVRLSIRIDEEITLLAKLQNRQGGAGFAVGDAIDVGWTEDQAWVI